MLEGVKKKSVRGIKRARLLGLGERLGSIRKGSLFRGGGGDLRILNPPPFEVSRFIIINLLYLLPSYPLKAPCHARGIPYHKNTEVCGWGWVVYGLYLYTKKPNIEP